MALEVLQTLVLVLVLLPQVCVRAAGGVSLSLLSYCCCLGCCWCVDDAGVGVVAAVSVDVVAAVVAVLGVGVAARYCCNLRCYVVADERFRMLSFCRPAGRCRRGRAVSIADDHHSSLCLTKSKAPMGLAFSDL